ncbi:MAG: RDD family protein [Steroidobacteraceae bacterium]
MDGNNQYAPPKSVVSDVQPHGVHDKAGRGARLGAYLLDALIFSLGWAPGYILFFSNAAIAARTAGAKPDFHAIFAASSGWFAFGLLWTLALLIVTLVLLKKHGQSIGKKLVGIRIVRSDGSAATLTRLFLVRGVVNGLFGGVPVVGPLYMLVDFLFIFGEPRRCVHDHLADTIVINA